MPQVAIGLRDIGGTSKFSSEYIVATKMVNNFDITFGLGYGNMGTQQNIRNPFSLISDSFDYRPYVTGGAFGGSLNQNLCADLDTYRWSQQFRRVGQKLSTISCKIPTKS